MSNGGREHRRWKERRWREDPRCAFCRVVTILRWEPPKGLPHGDPRKRPPSNLATIDHLRDRYDPTRQEPMRGRPEVRRVLACWKCNHERGEARTRAMPIEELWRRAGHYERKMYDLAMSKNTSDSGGDAE